VINNLTKNSSDIIKNSSDIIKNSSDIIKNAAEQSNFLTDTIAQLRVCNKESQILETTVRAIRQATNCDRVVIYSLQAADRGKIVAESVDGKYTKTIDRVIVDPCFEARYIHQYQMGRVRAIADIQQASMSACYVENLTKIDVKANLVVPIITSENQLYGLLVLHQCSSTRNWQTADIDLCIQVAAQVGYALVNLSRAVEAANMRSELQRIHEWNEQMPAINKKLYGGSKYSEVLKIAAAETQQVLKCDRVVVYSLQFNSMGKIVAEVSPPALAQILGRTIVDPCFEHRYIEKYLNGRVRAIDNIFEAGMTECYVEMLNNIGVKSNLVAPIVFDNNYLLGLLVAHSCFEFRQWQPFELEQIRQIAVHTGWAITNARVTEKRNVLQKVTSTLTDAENHLRLALKANATVRVAEAEVTEIASEQRSLTRLLEQETMESSQKTPAEAQRLLNILANSNRLQGGIERLKAAQQQIEPEQRKVSELLNVTLQSIEDCPL
jgi:GAF domain-containing protein